MAEVSPIDIQRHLDGIDYPATREEIVEQARASGADETVMAKLETIPDRRYDGPDEVLARLGGTL